MSQRRYSLKQLTQLGLSVGLLVFVFGTVKAQETKDAVRPALDLEGNKVFEKAVLLNVINSQLDQWEKNGARYQPEMLAYCVHQLEGFMKSHGYLQGTVTQVTVEETETRPHALLKVKEGPLYRVGKMTVGGARLFTSEQVLDDVGLKTGDIANGQKLSEGLYERLKARYGKFGYVEYTAEVTPTFHAERGEAQGVVDFKLTIDEGEQFAVRSIKIDGADKAIIEALTRELLLRPRDVYDSELFRESITRMNRTGLVEPIDSDKDVDYQDNKRNYGEPALLDIVIHAKKPNAFAARQK